MKEFKLIIAGGRDFTDYELLKITVDKILFEKEEAEEVIIICGMSDGADMLGEQYAAERGYEVAEFSKDGLPGKKAGSKERRQMADFADSCVCFWNGSSPGTKSMIDMANEKGITIRVIRY